MLATEVMVYFSGKKRHWFLACLIVPVLLVSACSRQLPALKVGVVYSLTGKDAENGQNMLKATLLAIKEVNRQGGVLGRKLEAVVIDDVSSPETAFRETENLLRHNAVPAVFACASSACRQLLKPLVEKNGSLLFYNAGFEGLESSRHIIYTGASASQKTIPGVSWAIENLGRRLYVVGSDNFYSRISNRIVRDLIYLKQARLLGEVYPSGETSEKILQDIARQSPDVIINTLQGQSKQKFYRDLKKLVSRDIPVIDFSGDKPLMIESEKYYAVRNYWKDRDTPANRQFLASFQREYSVEDISDNMVFSHNAIHFWARAVNAAGSENPLTVRQVLGHQSLSTPAGVISIDPQSGYSWQSIYIGKIRTSGRFIPVWSSKMPMRPYPYPAFHNKNEWLTILQRIRRRL